MIHVFYHANCFDGFGAAWAASHSLGRAPSVVTYTPVQYGDPVPSYGPQDEIYILDFSWPRDTLEEMVQKAQKVTLIDHHASAKKHIDPPIDGLNAVFSEEKSGARLTWEYFNPQHKVNPQGIAKMILMIEDRDLWKFEINDTKRFNAYLRSKPMTFDEWDGVFLEVLKEELPNTVCWSDRGQTALDLLESQARKIASNSYVMKAGIPYAVCFTSTLRSEVADHLHMLYPKIKYSVTIMAQPDGMFKLSFRSRHGYNVRKIAEYYGGGGHDLAASAAVNSSAFLRAIKGDVMRMRETGEI